MSAVRDATAETLPPEGAIVLRHRYADVEHFYLVPADPNCRGCRGDGVLFRLPDGTPSIPWICGCVMLTFRRHLHPETPSDIDPPLPPLGDYDFKHRRFSMSPPPPPEAPAPTAHHDRHAFKRAALAEAQAALKRVQQEETAALAAVDDRSRGARERHAAAQADVRVIEGRFRDKMEAAWRERAAADKCLRAAERLDREAVALQTQALPEATQHLATIAQERQLFDEERAAVEKAYRRRALPHERKIESLTKRLQRAGEVVTYPNPGDGHCHRDLCATDAKLCVCTCGGCMAERPTTPDNNDASTSA